MNSTVSRIDQLVYATVSFLVGAIVMLGIAIWYENSKPDTTMQPTRTETICVQDCLGHKNLHRQDENG